MTQTKVQLLDLNGLEAVLDADADTTITADTDDQIDFKVGGTDVITLTNSSLALKGTTPTLTIGDGGAEDTKIVFDGNAQNFYIGLDDSADDLLIGLGSTVGTTPAIAIDENNLVTLPDGHMVIASTAAGDNLTLKSTNAGAEAGPQLVLHRDSASPANNDVLGRIRFEGEDNESNKTTYAQITSQIIDKGDSGGEDSTFQLEVHNNGGLRDIFSIKGTTGGTPEIVFNEDSQDVDVRFESDANTNMLKIDAANNQVLIGGVNATFGELGITGHGNGNSNIDMYQSCGSSVTGKAEIFFSTDSTSDHLSMASIVMQQPSGDQASRKGEMLLNVSDNGGPATALTVANNGQVSGNLNNTSDENLKKNIEDLEASTNIIKQLKPRKFDWKQTSAGSNIAGFIAQEVATVLPDAVVGNDYEATTFYEDGDTLPDGYIVGDVKELGNKGKALNTTAILAHAVKTIQELETRITDLES